MTGRCCSLRVTVLRTKHGPEEMNPSLDWKSWGEQSCWPWSLS